MAVYFTRRQRNVPRPRSHLDYINHEGCDQPKKKENRMSAIQQSSIISHVAPQKCTPTQDASVSYNSGGGANLSVADQSLPHEVSHDIYGQGEDDGGVLLRRDGVEGLQVAKLQG